MLSDDEIGELVKNFDTMTESVRTAFAQAEHSNQKLKILKDIILV
jgi:signal transduction histidine kinase